MTDVKPEVQKQITEIIDEYVISHKGNAQCKCIEGARGHLRAKLFGLFDTFNKKHEGAAIIVVCPKCNYPEESCKCVTPEALATALEEQEERHRERRTKWAFKTVGEVEEARADEREKVLSEVLEMVKHQRLSPKDGYLTDERKRHQNSLRAELRAKLNQLKEGKC